MLFRKFFILILITISISDFANAQQDSVKTDSTLLYKNIESYSKRSKFNGFIYRLIFKPAATDSTIKSAKRKAYKKLLQNQYSTFEGKIIRKIEIETLDPFGYSASDTIC